MKRRSFLCVLSSSVTILLAVVWTRAERLAAADSFEYLKHAKEYADVWPGQLSIGAFPAGYPFAGSLLAEVGLSSYWGLMTVSALGVVVTSFLAASLVPATSRRHWSTTTVFLSLGAAPVAALVLTSPLSDWLFTALVACTIFLFQYWPKPWSVWCTGLIVLSAFCVRYAGIFLLGVMGLYGIWVLYSTHRTDVHLHTISSIGLTGLTVAGLIALNIYQTGHLSGAARAPGGGVTAFPGHAAHLGWGFIGAVSSAQVAELVGGVESLAGYLIGGAVLSLVLLLCVRVLMQKKSPMQALGPVALVVSCYLVCMIIFRSISSFNDLSQPRFVLPVLYPVAVLVVSQIEGQMKNVVGIIAIGGVIVGVFAAGRGISKETHGNVDTAYQALSGTLSPMDTVFVSERARRLSAYFENAFYWERSSAFNDYREVLSELQSADYAVFGAQRKGRFGEGGYQTLSEPYRKLCARSDSSARIQLVTQDKTTCVLRVIEDPGAEVSE